MKIGITGTTDGIGRTLSERFKDVLTFNRTDGPLDDCALVFSKFSTCDVFINNAYDTDAQSKLLDYFYKQWRDTNKKIVSIGSVVCSYAPSGEGHEHYIDHKKKLRQVHLDIVKQKNPCRSFLVNPGPTDTKMISHRHCAKLTTDQIYKIIRYVLGAETYIPEIFFYAE